MNSKQICISIFQVLEFKCKYYGNERVNFSRGKQIANMALTKLKRDEKNIKNCMLLLTIEDLVISGDSADHAIVPYTSITFQVLDETDDQFAAIIAVIPDNPPQCMVIKLDNCLEVLQLLSHKSGVSF